MPSDIAIKVENLSKCYELYHTPRDRLFQLLSCGRKQYYKEFWALRDVSFELKKGETIGIVGRNGSGKSTLLQLLCGTLNPTSGTIETNGRLAALLELGAGFNPEFTGRENVYVNATILGLTQSEINARYDAIVAFADIGDFINQPVKMYSSGMYVRLAFAIQSQIDPDILIIDEALAVGDAKFQAKCFERLNQLKKRGTSILFVSHATEQIVTHCQKALLLDQGQPIHLGAPREVVNLYLDLLFGRDKEKNLPLSLQEQPQGPEESAYQLSVVEDVFSTRPGYNADEYRWGDGSATLLDYALEADGGMYPASVTSGSTMKLRVSIRYNAELLRPIFGLTIKTKEGVSVYGINSKTLAYLDFENTGQQDSVAYIEVLLTCYLAPGDYFISLGIATHQGEEVIPHDRRYDVIHFVVQQDPSFFGLANLHAQLSVKGTLC